MGFGNRIAIAVLRSPLHGLLSKSLLVLQYAGRRSGTGYELPLQYLDDDGRLYIWAGSAATKTWWRNFETPASVTVRLRGRDHMAKAFLLDGADQRADVLRGYLDRYSFTTASGRPKFIGRRWHPTDDELAEVARSIVVVVIEIA